jgi:flavin reductase (DIM6/NTAB) family NADH-FMN oxidoreductase RutF
MLHIEPKDVSVKEVHGYLLGGVAPRPIALVSTVSEDGIVNLSPFSFFNAFGANPPTVAFSPSTRGRDGTNKDTYFNLTATRECVIQAVTYDLVEQASLASSEYPPETDEFTKSGLTPVPSDIVRPPRVAESPFQMECRLSRMIELGDGPGSGNLAVCEVLKFHIAEDLFEHGIISPHRIDLAGRNSGSYYTRASGDAIFSVPKPQSEQNIGFDGIPKRIKESEILLANDLAQLAGAESIPSKFDVADWAERLKSEPVAEVSIDALNRAISTGSYTDVMRIVIALHGDSAAETWENCQIAARLALKTRDREFAWNALVYGMAGQ